MASEEDDHLGGRDHLDYRVGDSLELLLLFLGQVGERAFHEPNYSPGRAVWEERGAVPPETAASTPRQRCLGDKPFGLSFGQ